MQRDLNHSRLRRAHCSYSFMWGSASVEAGSASPPFLALAFGAFDEASLFLFFGGMAWPNKYCFVKISNAWPMNL